MRAPVLAGDSAGPWPGPEEALPVQRREGREALGQLLSCRIAAAAVREPQQHPRQNHPYYNILGALDDKKSHNLN